MIRENNRLLIVGRSTTSLESSELKTLILRAVDLNTKVYQAIQAVPGQVPGHLERTLIEEPFTLVDAIGRIAPVHLQFICSWEAFEAVLEHRFRDVPGERKVRLKEYTFQDCVTRRDVDRSKPWNRAFFPGQRIGMSLVFRGNGCDISSCPNCGSSAADKLDIGIQW